MAGHISCNHATLMVDDRRVAIAVDLGLFLPDTGTWGGIVRRVLTRLAVGLRDADEVRICLPTGEERRIRPLDSVHPSDEAFVSVPFMGEGTAPF
ncbi:hypothetical protein RKD27_003120 [Streptomyces sp. SAI-126]|uniref:hypothetical protein n=1 Tax=Streptomyces sp. SAI-126 TaxID=3377732 RepID=UPI003C7D6774